MQKIHWKYLLKTWLSILFIAPFLTDLLLVISRENSSKIGGLVYQLPITLIVSTIFSTPTFIILFITDYFLTKNKKDIRDIKFIIVCLTTAGTITTFLLFFGMQDFEIIFAYTLIAFVATSFYKLEKQ